MDFDPLNSEHSVQSANFTVIFDGAAPAASAQLLRARTDLLEELPAIQQPEGVEVAVGQGNALPTTRRFTGIQLSHLRPDGTPAWALQLMNNSLAVECTRYTRWNRVWDAAHRYLDAGLDAVSNAGQNKLRKVTTIGHQMVDIFVAKAEPYELDELIQQNDLVASRIFTAGPTWHSHVGWFEQPSDENILWLAQLNVDAVRTSGTTRPEGRSILRIGISHNQEIRFRIPIETNEAKRQLDSRMGELHLMNKRILRKILSPQMASRIALGEEP